MKRVSEFHKEGYNCAESIVKAINEEKELNIPVSMASPFGSGMTVGTTCGAVTGALMALGSVKGRETSKESNETKKVTKEVMNRIKEKYGTFQCLELKKKGVSCDEIIEYAYDILKKCID
ncbi:C-GCAxxG-C-C family (seleno)protein [Clostridium luticellarii]|jgi:C_GCAxxG_C_C family probable redox protein|uniref:Putative redox-active protein n=1 Tax=Clostridium luticellarii TaxID=1691940 RepID=A0A2T0BMP9_9CLOT|nr:C-GCAxxG-C-C family (seleno)protein [Clostridium luticellarii]MCI1945749.1 C-GCAxxG-C-C family protein [Clostridium luticellarii]MCI1969081.1 C-GCAxxG-C-C family protein [Clostridium luticellarii]MCI1996329.1 C-GCAxxG-C-C family protein [Clostridium luticellarii]MCI2040656.1 C-GCAxxG-C-C family protein [Clostridium luticellarii]PRR85155.1 putative redox-active protein [Clostridium luticellarii]